MSDVILYLSVAGALVVISFILSLIFRRRTAEDDGKASDELRDPDQAPVNRQAGPRRVAGARQVRSRFEAQRARQEQRRRDAPQDDPDFDRQSGSDDEEDDGGAGDDIVFPGGKIGVKKRRKLEMKAEKRAQREAELQDREEKKMRQAKEDEERRRQQEHEKQEEMKREDEAKKIREEKAKREHEAYLQLKQSFQVESEGFEEKDNEEENDLLTKFVEYIKSEKVIVLEDLAVRFNLKTQEAIDRVHSLLQDGTLIGVIDDRGKFIYITAEELESIARFIRQRGRVSIADIAESSNTLISLASKQTVETN